MGVPERDLIAGGVGDGDEQPSRARRQRSYDPQAARPSERPPTRDVAERLADVLDPAMSVLGIVFLLLVLGEGFARGQELRTGFAVTGWIIWGLFVLEFVARLIVAPSRWGFLRRNWWQVLFLLVPFLRFLRLIRTLRLARAGRLLSSAVRSSRSAGRTLGGRLGWLLAVHVIVVLTTSQLLFEFGAYDRYATALHEVALAAVASQPLVDGVGLVARAFEVVLATYAVVVFGAIAATLGAYFIQRQGEVQERGAPSQG